METHKKSEYLRARATPTQAERIAAHCGRLGCSMGSRILDLLRQDILDHRHFDIQIEIGPIRRPKVKRVA